MTKGRLEAFSDGVIAIIITIMVLELRPPAGARLEDLSPLVPTFLSYALSFALLVSLLIYAGVVVLWLVPDRRMEQVIRTDRPPSE